MATKVSTAPIKKTAPAPKATTPSPASSLLPGTTGLTAVSASVSPSMTSLQSQYTQQQTDYAALVANAQTLKTSDSLSKAVDKIKAKNREIQATLDQMLGAVATAKQDSAVIGQRRQELQQRLREIDEDYRQLVASNDTMETLKRIRGYEETKVNTTIQMYFMAFIASLVLLAIVVFAFGYRSKSATTPTPAMSPATTSFM